VRLLIELYYQEVWLVLDNIYMRICLAPTHVIDQGLPIQQLPCQGGVALVLVALGDLYKS
jgi:hypothetical protein